ncbi:MAG TPA: translation elongation factor Ts [Actinomycetota bacterium]|nr:translation elongation factor Ts [Actinomycetota bacterium]
MSDPKITAEEVRVLRELTGAGMMDCKRALQDAGGDLARAQEILRERGLAAAGKRAGRSANEGVIEAYIHPPGKLGVLVEVNSETDFVANTEEFGTLARNVAMHIAALAPRWISRDDVPEDVVLAERKIYAEQARTTGKPEHVLEKIVEGKLRAFFKQTVLLDQPFIRDDSVSVGDLVARVSAKVGEKIAVRRFARFKLGEEA